MKTLTAAMAALAACAFAGSANAEPLCSGKDLGFAGLLAKCNRGETIELTLSSGKPLYAGEGTIKLQSGAYYTIAITADGSAELAVTGPEFFRAVWLNEIVINNIEVRPMAIDSLEFDDAGTAEISFIAIKPGRFDLHIPGTHSDTQSVKFSIQ
ncbi:hypothetical protein HDIA_4290 [Hartmannibacter diazotrophicus]|uniref:MSP domain-containing protein n=1 Tax=Hartmannibacter diazotrophicus TaxID=1482074 RepID=A0A2C9DDJ9_9HYPH|nr:hypothetical protein [Hartmannibacter diazotrophicus]SON57831.1 hypothetical protein HDIA_4290 [Hartmannibacter diazotrophicus]